MTNKRTQQNMPNVIRGVRRPKLGIVCICLQIRLGTVLSGNVLIPDRIARVFWWTEVYGYWDGHLL